MAGKNPSSVIFWNDLENDEHLKTCSLAAKGLWDHHMLPMAARSSEPGVVLLGAHPSRLDQDLPVLLARAVGESPDTIRGLLRELLDSGAASVDDAGRIYNRRMVREEAIRQARSQAGKRGADATNAKRQKSGKGVVEGDAEDIGNGVDKGDGKPTAEELSVSADATRDIPVEPATDERQTVGNDTGDAIAEAPDESSHSSFLHASDSNDVTTARTEVTGGADAPDDDAFDQPLFLARGDLRLAVDLWNEAADRAGWPKVQKITPKRRRLLIDRLTDSAGIEGWKAALAKAEASSFLTGKTGRSADHANWRCTIDFILGDDQFTKLREGGFDDAPSHTNGNGSSRVQHGGESPQPDGISAAFARRSVLAGG